MRMIIFLVLMVLLVGCAPKPAALAPEPSSIEQVSPQVVPDTEPPETIENADVQEDIVLPDVVAPEPVPAPRPANSDFCMVGEDFYYGEGEARTRSEIVGLEEYEGMLMCKAQSSLTLESPAGEIKTDTTYYFDEDVYELWIVTLTSGPMMSEPQEYRAHLIGGQEAE